MWLRKKSATIKDWRVVSKVRLNLLELDPAKVPQFIRDSLTNPNDYSVRQLLINFTSMTSLSSPPSILHSRLIASCRYFYL